MLKPKTPKKALKRWNARKKVSGQSLLIYFVIQKFGGARRVAQHLKLPLYIPTNWHQDGAVPLKYLDALESELGIPRIGLNYKAVKNLLGKLAPAWDKVVKEYKFEKEIESRILKAGPPK